MTIAMTSSVSRRPRHEQIAASLRQQIRTGGLTPHEPLPSYRQLMSEHGVTVGTIRQAIRSLQDQGLVYSQPGIGCKVSPSQEASGVCRVGLVIVGPTEMHWLINQLSQLQDELDRRKVDLTLRFVRQMDDASLESLTRWACRMDGLLLAGHVPFVLGQHLATAGVCVTQLGELIDQPCPPQISQITIDVQGTIALATSHLVSLGHRHIALCMHQVESRYFQLLARGFEKIMADHGLAPAMHRGNVGSQTYMHDLITWFEAQQPRPSALIVEEATRASLLIQMLGEKGLVVPDQLSVISIASDMAQSRVLRDLTAVLTPGRTLVLTAIDAITRMHEAGVSQVRVEKIVPRFWSGRTTASILPPAKPAKQPEAAVSTQSFQAS